MPKMMTNALHRDALAFALNLCDSLDVVPWSVRTVGSTAVGGRPDYVTLALGAVELCLHRTDSRAEGDAVLAAVLDAAAPGRLTEHDRRVGDGYVSASVFVDLGRDLPVTLDVTVIVPKTERGGAEL